MDFALIPPEINSARMYSGPGAGPLLAGAAAWDGLAAEFTASASAYQAVVAELTSGSWQGPSSIAMAAAAERHVSWMTAAATRAEEVAVQAKNAVAAYEAAFAMTVPPPEIAVNRTLLMTLIATNILGQNTAAIAATEAQYVEMWVQDATAMYGYAGAAAAASVLTPLTLEELNSNLAGLRSRLPGLVQFAVTTAERRLSTLISAVPNALQSLASATTPGDVLAVQAGLLTTFAGPNLFGYPVGFAPAISTLASVNTFKAAGTKFFPAAKAPAPAAGAGLGAQGGGKLLSAGAAETRAGIGVQAQMGRAFTTAGLSVPSGWPASTPFVRPAAVALSTPLVLADGSGTLLSELGMAALAGRAVGRVASGYAARATAPSRSSADAPPGAPESLEELHAAIVSEVLAAADYWGGFGSRACQDFIMKLGFNFQVIYEHIEKQGAATRVDDKAAARHDTG